MSPTTPINPNKRNWIVPVAAVLIFAGAIVITKSVQSSREKFSDAEFVAKAALGGRAEVQLGQLAAQKGESEAVRNFGQRMASDHAKANQKLEQAAASENMALPQGLDKDAQETFDKLSKLSGPAFDRSYARDMVKDHKQDVSEFQKEAQNGKNETIRTVAADTLPILQDHLKEARAMDDSVSDKNVPRMPTVPR
jgi:putative membrane protein